MLLLRLNEKSFSDDGFQAVGKGNPFVIEVEGYRVSTIQRAMSLYFKYLYRVKERGLPKNRLGVLWFGFFAMRNPIFWYVVLYASIHGYSIELRDEDKKLLITATPEVS